MKGLGRGPNEESGIVEILAGWDLEDRSMRVGERQIQKQILRKIQTTRQHPERFLSPFGMTIEIISKFKGQFKSKEKAGPFFQRRGAAANRTPSATTKPAPLLHG
jgi:hypothetical protein